MVLPDAHRRRGLATTQSLTGIAASGRPVSVIVDRTAGLIHFQNCHWLNKFLVVRAEPWFTCPLGDVVSARHDRECEHGLYITTNHGWASILPKAPNFNALCEELDRSLGHIVDWAGTVTAGHPKHSYARLIYTGLSFVGVFVGAEFSPGSASMGTVALRMFLGGIGCPALAHFCYLFFNLWRKTIDHPLNKTKMVMLEPCRDAGAATGIALGNRWLKMSMFEPIIAGIIGMILGCHFVYRLSP